MRMTLLMMRWRRKTNKGYKSMSLQVGLNCSMMKMTRRVTLWRIMTLRTRVQDAIDDEMLFRTRINLRRRKKFALGTRIASRTRMP